ncbi:hypothetical protein NHP190003_13550 [Helicobacter sp. NHP19-003]|uniref:Uncharacterized protein n=1 Tax=Helicobacter gastrocanis TaxID=2849641 RepID=A0ABM7SBQ6_9HELI|nr:hypothetical protein [Helicobacter sp. NHP19-003]BCZ18073.1 hypothetical protein NHP190003_13550 [Helicobacter sp. NHP19-003]
MSTPCLSAQIVSAVLEKYFGSLEVFLNLHYKFLSHTQSANQYFAHLVLLRACAQTSLSGDHARLYKISAQRCACFENKIGFKEAKKIQELAHYGIAQRIYEEKKNGKHGSA